MASNWNFGGGGGGGSTSNWDFGGGGTKTKAPSGHAGGITGLLSNLGFDAEHFITDSYHGAIPGAVAAYHTLWSGKGLTEDIGFGKHTLWGIPHAVLSPLSNPHKPKQTFLNDPEGLGPAGKAFVVGEKHTYGAALHGNFHPLYEHPLTPILDAATLLTLGGAGLARVGEIGVLGERAAQLAREARVLKSGDLAEQLNKGRTLQGMALQRKLDAFSEAHPDLRIVGANPRLSRIANARAFRASERYRIPVKAFQRITNGLTKQEQFAMHIAAEGVPLDERIGFYRNLLKDNPDRHIDRYLKRLEDPRVADVLANPSEKLIKALGAAKDLEEHAGQTLIDAGKLTPEIRAERALLPQRIMRGPESLVRPYEGVNLVHEDFPRPFRLPHQAEGARPGLYTPPKAPLGKVKDLGQLKKNEGVRLATARIETNPEVWSRDYLQTIRHHHQLDLQRDVLDKVAKPLDASDIGRYPGGKAPDEFYYRPSKGRKSTEPIPREVKEQETLGQDLESTHTEASLDKASKGTVFNREDMPEDLRSLSVEALSKKGVYRVPKAFGKRYQEEFAGSGKIGRFFFDRPLDVWRAITLNARPAWMVNNLIGNNVMFALRHPGGAEAYVRALLATEKGDAKVVQLRNFTLKIPTLRRKYGRIFDEVAPEIHSSGLYGATVHLTHKGIYDNGPFADRAHLGKVAKVVGVAPRALIGALKGFGRGVTWLEQHIAEDVPRDAAMLRETKDAVNKLKLAGMSTEDALKSLDKRDVELAVDRVNDFLGDFNSLSLLERRYIRRAIPFAAWYRVIFTVSAKLAVRYPARLKMIQLFEQAQKQDDEGLPPWLKGSIFIGGKEHNIQTLLSTSGINPYQTLTQATTENPGSMLNPFAQALGTGIFNKDAFTGGDYYGWGSGTGTNPADVGKRAVGSFLYGSVPGSLATKLFAPPPSTVYAPHTYGHVGPVPINDALLQYLGVPIRHVKVKKKS